MGKAVCLVTGSSRGIGKSTVLEMAKSGELVIKQDNTFSDIVCEVTNNE